MKRYLNISLLVSVAIILCSCGSTKEINYFQDTSNLSKTDVAIPMTITVQPTDQLSIVVTSKDPLLASIFNLPIISTSLSNQGSGRFATVGTNSIATYTIDSEGFIDFPILGKLFIKGMKREQIASMIKSLIISGNYLKDPVVTVEFANLYVSVLGDVRSPGRVVLGKDKVTILEVLASVGDLNITGQRKDVRVFREEDGKQVCYNIDLTDSKSVFQSPVYYLRQNDIIYVNPNRKKMRDSTASGNQLLTPSFWISVVSMLTTVTSVVITVLNFSK